MTDQTERFGTQGDTFGTLDGFEANDGACNGMPATDVDCSRVQHDAPTVQRMSVYLPYNTRWRLKVVSAFYGCTVSDMVVRAIEDLLDEPECEPRPYIPKELAVEETGRLVFLLPVELAGRLDERSLVEGRQVCKLIHRAILNRIDGCEGDPCRCD